MGDGNTLSSSCGLSLPHPHLLLGKVMKDQVASEERGPERNSTDFRIKKAQVGSHMPVTCLPHAWTLVFVVWLMPSLCYHMTVCIVIRGK